MCGTPLAGEHSKSEIFGEKVVIWQGPVKSCWRNPALLARAPHEDDEALQKVLWEETMKEVAKGWLL